ncbi:MAG: hypothetical protein NE334_00695 [Lentisphaeraceae bacterium]|nr:hypothetical protein [Lentisphaeraceae bacterium]
MKWLLIPGWATAPDIFEPYLDLISSPLLYNWGFETNSSISDDERILNELEDNDFGIISFSMGCLKSLEISQKLKPKKLIFIGGFSNFCGTSNRSQRQAQIGLMIKGLHSNPQKVLKRFYLGSQINESQLKGELNTDNLIKGLEKLKNDDFSSISNSLKLENHLIQGIQDAIVPNDIYQTIIGEQTIVHEIEGGHGMLDNNRESVRRLLSQIL